MTSNTASTRPVRKPLNHSAHFHGRFGATYFTTICCQRRGVNQLCLKPVASVLFETAQRYHVSHRWYLKLLLLMPDHLHMLIGVPSDTRLSSLIRDFKRITARIANVSWQRNFFDHRLRHDESENEKVAYIRENPVRARLITEHEEWPYAVNVNDLDSRTQSLDCVRTRRLSQSPLPELAQSLAMSIGRFLGKAHQQHKRDDGQHDPDHLKVVQ
jgi:putative transposase